jgi:hypothetical protein
MAATIKQECPACGVSHTYLFTCGDRFNEAKSYQYICPTTSEPTQINVVGTGQVIEFKTRGAVVVREIDRDKGEIRNRNRCGATINTLRAKQHRDTDPSDRQALRGILARLEPIEAEINSILRNPADSRNVPQADQIHRQVLALKADVEGTISQLYPSQPIFPGALGQAETMS